MLFNRLKQPEDEGVMYHYCSAATFHSIISNRTIRFSDLNLLNDAEEGRWGYDVFLEAANRILSRQEIPELLPEVPVDFIDRVDAVWHYSSLTISSFLACFSVEGDSLSQWRAYADDGRGFSIGFSLRELRRLPVQILEVLYDREAQLKEMIIALGALFMEMEAENRHDDEKWMIDRCMLLKSSAVAFKNPAWRDEREIRCQHVVVIDVSTPVWRIEAAGGESDGKPVDPLPIGFQVREAGMIVPYFDMPFEVSADHVPIKEIWLGPKNQNALGNIKLFLGNNGYGPIEMKNAGGAYR
jgi:hypothetical protein